MAVPSQGSQPAVAASPEDLASLRVSQSFKLNNVALEWVRDSHEDPPGNPTTDCVDLTLSDPLQIGVIEKSTGMDYKFKECETQPWSCRTRAGSGGQGGKKRSAQRPLSTCLPCPLCHQACSAHRRNPFEAYCSHGLPHMDIHEWTSSRVV